MSRGRHIAPRTRSGRVSWGVLGLVLGLFLAMAMPVGAQNGNAPNHAPDNTGTVQGSAEDPNHPGLGEIEYLFNKSGYHFWFTPTENIGRYTAGHSYHNVYKYDLEDPSDWCGPVGIPDRLPYNAADTDGGSAYYKIWDVTAETWVCGSG